MPRACPSNPHEIKEKFARRGDIDQTASPCPIPKSSLTRSICAWPLPLNFQLGVAMDLLQGAEHKLTVETDAVHPLDNTESLHLGAEYAFKDLFFLRAGYRNLFQRDSEEGITAGGGFYTNLLGNVSIGIDYAYAHFGRLENAQRFSVCMRF